MTTDAPLTPIEVAATLNQYAAAHGRYWKQALRDSWLTGKYDTDDDAPTLQRIRNAYGPSWLTRFRR